MADYKLKENDSGGWLHYDAIDLLCSPTRENSRCNCVQISEYRVEDVPGLQFRKLRFLQLINCTQFKRGSALIINNKMADLYLLIQDKRILY